MSEVRKLRRVVIKEELFSITNDTFEAIMLGQLLYWQERVNDFDKFISEEKNRAKDNGCIVDINLTNGWMYKKASELIDECMLTISETTARKYLKSLEIKSFISSRTNPIYKWDKILQYRVNISNIINSVKLNGFDGLDGYKSIMKTHENSNPENLASIQNNLDSNSKNFAAIPEITLEITSNKEKKDTYVSKEKYEKFDFLKALLDLGVEEQVAKDWMLVRKNKKATNSETAFNAIKRELEKSSLDPTKCISIAVERDWKGIKAEWLKNAEPSIFDEDYIKGRINQMQKEIDEKLAKSNEDNVVYNGKTYR